MSFSSSIAPVDTATPAPASLAFLRTEPLETWDGVQPLMRSSLAHRHRALGAELVTRSGWVVPVAYPGEADRATAGVSDLSHVAKLEAWGDEPTSTGTLAAVPVGRDHWHVLCPFADVGALRAAIAERGRVVDRTSAWNVLGLSGGQAETLLRRLTSIRDLPGRGPVGKVPGTVLTRPGGFWIVVSQEVVRYVWDLAVDLAEPLGGGPVGADAAWGSDPLLQ